MSKVKNVVLVGHCGFDARSLMRAVEQALPTANFESADNAADLERFGGDDSLLLINRLLDGSFDAANGIELIRKLATGPSRPRTMLISNLEDAQEQAEQAGALPGFGKGDLHTNKATDRLREAAEK